MLNKFSSKQKIYFVVAIFILLSLFMLGIALSRTGKTKVNVEIIPSDAQLFINDRGSSAGEVYLKPGTYTFSAKKEGYLDDKQIIIVGDNEEFIGLVPTPNSNEARRWLKDNPSIQAKRESIGGKMAALRGEYVQQKTPLIDYLPYTDVIGPFTIDFGSSTSRQYGTFLEINYSTPKGREGALKWIRSKGQDPTDYEIRYGNDFKNPLLPVDTEEGAEEGPNE